MTTSPLKGGPTQPEVCAVSLHKLGVQKDDIAIDIGCGTGTVSLAIAATARQVYAVDIRPEAVGTARENIRSAGCSNITLVEGDAIALIREMERIDVAFIGGTQGLTGILTLLAEKRVRSIVVNAVLIETVASAIETMKSLGIFQDAVLLQVSRSHDLLGKTMFKPINPVYIIHGGVVPY
ncbi:cobalt-precorrin-6B (C15)-methyltransferase [Methanocalculus alkaliphilus]|uniref:precorrin-6Y C5,15-methyltransferase (decarboxylating) subunit CbiT n=1 Tax=Methanocalculus alkaliphilus TaxID=768730 RepID=UPI0020A03986|nr:precorrin-6Y C5,15-methyltransferase (decarboxylating) subunit CbiT [Methanocalculus alkaliphilus]MCP1714733.1 cobalt-precorrin-6B (C15)-methyltransferase [Methanocalculus alkaliphilus]